LQIHSEFQQCIWLQCSFGGSAVNLSMHVGMLHRSFTCRCLAGRPYSIVSSGLPHFAFIVFSQYITRENMRSLKRLFSCSEEPCIVGASVKSYFYHCMWVQILWLFNTCTYVSWLGNLGHGIFMSLSIPRFSCDVLNIAGWNTAIVDVRGDLGLPMGWRPLRLSQEPSPL
jgi:hypothetical protein